MKDTAIGCDIEEIGRFKGNSDRFCKKLFSRAEIEYCRAKPSPAQHFAARFCAKEAVVKALHSLGVSGIYYKDIEIRKQGSHPAVDLPGFEIRVSLSHSEGYAMAVALVKRAG
jgi:phosphopantetheine--protein transferase-like protein